MESKRRTAPTKLAVKGHYNYKAPLDGAEMMAANPYLSLIHISSTVWPNTV